jgi:hypothetical protein
MRFQTRVAAGQAIVPLEERSPSEDHISSGFAEGPGGIAMLCMATSIPTPRAQMQEEVGVACAVSIDSQSARENDRISDSRRESHVR